jgi:hypothetical protein
MSSKFGLPPETDSGGSPPSSISERLANFQPSQPRKINIAEVDLAAAPHGFVSREPVEIAPPVSRRRRRAQKEPTRGLGIRLPISQYQRFVEYADKYGIGYHDAIKQLLDEVEGK